MIARKFLDTAFRPLTDEEYTTFQKLEAAFLEKNKVINLSALRDPQSVWEKHFYDSLLGAEFLQEAGDAVLDLGSGGGFPLFPLAILFPEKKFLALDAVGKKLKALQEIARELKLRNIAIHHGRAEEGGRDSELREKFDLVIVRAFAPFAITLELSFPFVRNGGKILLYRGPEMEGTDERLISKLGGHLETRKKAMLPQGEQREIWEIRKIQPTRKEFPRPVGIPKKFPLTISYF